MWLNRWRCGGSEFLSAPISTQAAFPRRGSPSVHGRIACGSFPSSPYAFPRSVRSAACTAYSSTARNSLAPDSSEGRRPIRREAAVSATARGDQIHHRDALDRQIERGLGRMLVAHKQLDPRIARRDHGIGCFQLRALCLHGRACGSGLGTLICSVYSPEASRAGREDAFRWRRITPPDVARRRGPRAHRRACRDRAA